MYAQLNDPPPAPSTIRSRSCRKRWIDGRREGDGEVAPTTAMRVCAEFVDALRAAVRVQVREAVPVGRAGTTVTDGRPRRSSRPASAETARPARWSLGRRGRSRRVDIVGGYKIERRLGGGGMGVVYLAERPRLGSKVALKILRSELASDERFRDRFVRESQMASALDHPNIIPVYDASETDGAVLHRHALRRRSQHEGVAGAGGAARASRRAMVLLAQVGSALDTAHEHGLIHRDVKPANILVAKGGASEFGEHAYLDRLRRLEAAGLPLRPDGDRPVHRHAELCSARADRGQVGRPSCGHLRARLRALRVADRVAAIREGERRRSALGARDGAASEAQRRPTRSARGAR